MVALRAMVVALMWMTGGHTSDSAGTQKLAMRSTTFVYWKLGLISKKTMRVLEQIGTPTETDHHG